MYTYNHPRPAYTVDIVLIREVQESRHILLIRRASDPFQGKFALPGGFVEYGETTEDAIVREFLEETGLNVRVKNLIGVYSDPKRDPRGHTISVVYELIKIDGMLESGDDAADACYYPLSDLPSLAFDHQIIINDILRRKKDEVLP